MWRSAKWSYPHCLWISFVNGLRKQDAFFWHPLEFFSIVVPMIRGGKYGTVAAHDQLPLLHSREPPTWEILFHECTTADERAAADLDAGVDGGVDAEATVIADDRAEFTEAGADALLPHVRLNFSFIESQVPRHAPGAKRDILSDHAVPDVGAVRPDVAVEDGGFHFAVVSHNTVLTDTAAAHECVVADNSSPSEMARAYNRRVRQNAYVLLDHHWPLDDCSRMDRCRGIDRLRRDLFQQQREELQQVPRIFHCLPCPLVGRALVVEGFKE